MKAKTIFLPGVICAILLATQIAKPPQAIPKPSSTQTVIPEIFECLISDFDPIDKGQSREEETLPLPKKLRLRKQVLSPRKSQK